MLGSYTNYFIVVRDIDIHISVLQNVLLHPTLYNFGFYREISSVWLVPLHRNLNSYFFSVTATFLFRENGFYWQGNRKYWLLLFLIHNLFYKRSDTVFHYCAACPNFCIKLFSFSTSWDSNFWIEDKIKFIEGSQVTNSFAGILSFFPLKANGDVCVWSAVWTY